MVGALIGLAGAIAYALAVWLGLPPWPAAVLALATTIWLTGALHEDGLADVADGFGGGRTREDKLAIMRDPRIGSYGALALVLAVLARAGAMAALAEPAAVAAALVAAGAASRAALPAVMAALPQARPDGLAAKGGAAASVARRRRASDRGADRARHARRRGARRTAAGALGALAVALLARRQIGG